MNQATSEVYIGMRACRVIRRLSSLNLSKVKVKRRVIRLALENYFLAHELPWRPVRWAESARDGFKIVAESGSFPDDLSSALLNRRRAQAETRSKTWNFAWRAASRAMHADVWETIKTLVSDDPRWSIMNASSNVSFGEKTRRALRQWLIVWREAIDVMPKIPLVIAEYADIYSSNYRAEATEHYRQVWWPFIEAYRAGLWLFWITEKEIVVVPRPVVHLSQSNGRFRLHSVTEPAVYYPNGERHYFIHGVQVPPEIVEAPAHELDPRLVLREQNVDVRREIVRKIGIERVCEELKARCVDRQGDYELLLLDLFDGRLCPYLKMKNPSIGVYHLEGVAPHCRTVAEALAWRNQTDIPPAVLT